MKKKYVYIVKSPEMCECGTECFCDPYTIAGVFFNKEKAEAKKEKEFRAYIDRYEVE